MKVKLKDPEEIQSLLDAEKYKQHVEESAHWPFSHPTCTIGTSNFSCGTLSHKICNFHLHVRQLIGGYLCELMSFLFVWMRSHQQKVGYVRSTFKFPMFECRNCYIVG
jgi:hypothetical protein